MLLTSLNAKLSNLHPRPYYLLKKVFLILLALTSLTISAQTHIMVISDPHVLIQSLFDDSTALRKAIDTDSKVFEHSQELFDNAIVRIQQAHPDILLIPGDMTYNGELANHQYVATELDKLVAAGTQVFVVPGNHDIANQGACSYLGEHKTPVPTISATEFTSLYAHMGYEAAVLREPDGLSYMVYPTDSLAIICLNSTLPNNKQQYSAGGLTEQTLSWAESAAAMAREDERYIIGMMHHPIVEHFNLHTLVAPNYIANQVDTMPSLSSMQQRLSSADIQVMLTGHFHITSIQHADSLYDITTGSTCAYASPMRTISLYEGGLLHVTTNYINQYHNLEQQRNVITARGAIRSVANRLYPAIDSLRHRLDSMTYGSIVVAMMNIPYSAAEMAKEMETYMLPAYTDLVNVLSHGDEDLLQPDTIYQHCMDALDAYTDHVWGTDIEPILLLDHMRQIFDIVTTLPVKLLVSSTIRSVVNNYVTLPTNYVPDSEFDFQLTSHVKPLQTGLIEQQSATIPAPIKTIRNGVFVIERNGQIFSVLGTRL